MTQVRRAPEARAAVSAVLGGVLLMLVVAAIAWNRVPDRLGIHVDSAGVTDGYAGKAVGLLAFPVLLLIAGALVWSPVAWQARSGSGPWPGSAAALASLWILTVLLSGLQLAVVLTALGPAVRAESVAAACLGWVLVLIGLLLRKSRPHWVFGIRNRWTLASPEVWQRTHRLAGPLFVGVGAVAIVAAIAGLGGLLGPVAGAFAVLPAIVVGYSWLLGRVTARTL